MKLTKEFFFRKNDIIWLTDGVEIKSRVQNIKQGKAIPTAETCVKFYDNWICIFKNYHLSMSSENYEK